MRTTIILLLTVVLGTTFGSALAAWRFFRYPEYEYPEQAASAAAPPPAEQALQTDLAALRAMLDAGQEEQARAAYAKLRERCVECELPARLEDALRTLPD